MASPTRQDVVLYRYYGVWHIVEAMMDRWNDGGWGWGGWLAMGLMMLVFWTAVAAAVAMLVRNRRHDGAPASGSLHHDAERVLNERFAKGEIDEEELVRRRDVLRR